MSELLKGLLFFLQFKADNINRFLGVAPVMASNL